MSDANEVTAALDWADRMVRGELGSYDAYIVALAGVVREQREQLAVYEAVLGDGADRPSDWDELLKTTALAFQRIAVIEKAIAAIVLFDPLAAERMTLRGEEFRVVGESDAIEVARAIDHARNLLHE